MGAQRRQQESKSLPSDIPDRVLQHHGILRMYSRTDATCIQEHLEDLSRFKNILGKNWASLSTAPATTVTTPRDGLSSWSGWKTLSATASWTMARKATARQSSMIWGGMCKGISLWRGVLWMMLDGQET